MKGNDFLAPLSPMSSGHTSRSSHSPPEAPERGKHRKCNDCLSYYVLEMCLVLGLLPAPEASVPGRILAAGRREGGWTLRDGSGEPSVGRGETRDGLWPNSVMNFS